MFSKQKDTHKTTENTEAATSDTTETAPKDAATPPPEQPSAPEAAQEPAPQPPQETPELAAMKDRYTRLMADFDNFRKRQIRDREDWIKRANEDLLGDLLPVVDHLELALKKAADPADPVATGVKLVYDQLVALLARYNVTPIDAQGKPFDPTFHEALSQMTSATVPEHMVIDQFRRGWMLAGRLLRPAQVIVSAGAPDPETEAAENESVSD